VPTHLVAHLHFLPTQKPKKKCKCATNLKHCQKDNAAKMNENNKRKMNNEPLIE
jgi:cell fate (sporulation/competence/biofilm development) regulator YmcA (YheA/YmcA/DUF963 family)